MAAKVLILLGDAGGGHMSAAKAIAAGFQISYPQVEVKILDLSVEVSKFPFNATDQVWQNVSKYPFIEAISNFGYELTNTYLGNIIAHKVVLADGGLPLVKIIQRESPDVVISTHFIVSAVLEKVKYLFPGLKTVSVAADLVGFPRMLADHSADLIFCATAEAALRLEDFGIRSENIRFPYFPVNPNLQNYQGRTKFLRQIGLNPKLKIILITGGGLGTISMLDTIRTLLKLPGCQLIIVAGKKKATFELFKHEYANFPNVKVIQFVDNIQDYFNAADLVVAKPGPATIVELEIFRKPTLFTKMIGQQELGNIDFLMQNPNFVYLGKENGSTLSEASRLLMHKYIAFDSRFNFNSSVEIAIEIMTSLGIA